MIRLGPYRLYLAIRCWEWGREEHPFCGDVLLHFGPFHFHRRMTARDYGTENA